GPKWSKITKVRLNPLELPALRPHGLPHFPGRILCYRYFRKNKVSDLTSSKFTLCDPVASCSSPRINAMDELNIKSAVIDALAAVTDESSGKSIIDAHLLEAVDVQKGVVDIKLKVPADISKDARWDLEDNVADAVESIEGVSDVNVHIDRKSTRLNSSHVSISYAVFCLKKTIKRLLQVT